jgi:hypothetical protein
MTWLEAMFIGGMLREKCWSFQRRRDLIYDPLLYLVWIMLIDRLLQCLTPDLSLPIRLQSVIELENVLSFQCPCP